MTRIYSIIYRLVLLFAVCFSPFLLHGQAQTIDYPTTLLIQEQYDQLLNPNEVLSYGKYFENEYVCDLGHPFFLEDVFYEGDVTFRSQKFTKVQLQFNAFTHELVVKYLPKYKKQTAFIPPIDFISEFTIDGHKFVNFDFLSERNYHFYEEVYIGDISCYLLWYKKSSPSDHNRSFMTREFTDIRRQLYLRIDGKMYEVNRKGDFFELEPDHKKAVTKYMKNHRLKFGKSSKEELSLFLEFYEDLKTSKSETNNL